MTDVEIGLKADWDIDGVKLRTNVDGFHDDYQIIVIHGINNPVIADANTS